MKQQLRRDLVEYGGEVPDAPTRCTTPYGFQRISATPEAFER